MPTSLVRTSAALGAGIRSSVPKLVARRPGILFVNDDVAFCYVAAKALRYAGHDVSIAYNHRAALQIQDNPQPVDLLMTAIVMLRRVNGFARAGMARLRRLDLRIVYMTGYGLPGHEAIVKILRKPIAMECLLAEAGLALVETKTSRSA